MATSEKVCEAQPHCACLTPVGDGLDEYTCNCIDDGARRCSKCRARLVRVSTYERRRAAETSASI